MATTGSYKKLTSIFKYRLSHAFVVPQHAECSRCLRPFSTIPPLQAGHSKWSKTKHIKAVTDKKKNMERFQISQRIISAVKMNGADPKNNPGLASILSAAAKSNTPKQVIEQAVLRGEGKSLSGGTLDPCNIEALMPPDIAILITTETDNKNRTRADINNAIKKCEGQNGNTQFYFTKRGRAILARGNDGPTLTEVMDAALEIKGTEDVEEIETVGDFVVWTEPAALMVVTKALAGRFGLEVIESDIRWDASDDTKVDVNSSESAERLAKLLMWVREYPEVRAIHANVRKGSDISEDEWDKIESYLDL